MMTGTGTSALQDRVWNLERELARQKTRNDIEAIRYETKLMLRELIIWGLAMAFLMCFLWKAI